MGDGVRVKRTAPLLIALIGLAACGNPAVLSGPPQSPFSASSEQKLAFAVLPGSAGSHTNNVDIWVSDVHGHSAEPFLASDAAEFYPKWSPDGSRLAFVSDREEPGNMDIYVATSDGSTITRVTEHAAIDTAPSWSPDGTRIAFSRSIESRDEIFLVMADGTNEIRLTDNRSVDGPVEWSPDGSELAFARNEETQVDIWLMDADGTNQRRLTNDAAAETSLSWAPDGTQLAVTRTDTHGDDLEVAVISIREGAIRQVTDDDQDQRHVTWSPDGDELIFGRSTVGSADHPRTPSALFVLDLRTGRQQQVGATDRAALTPSWRR